MSDETIRILSEAIESRGRRSPDEQFEDMVRRGAIDLEGNVILRRPDDCDAIGSLEVFRNTGMTAGAKIPTR